MWASIGSSATCSSSSVTVHVSDSRAEASAPEADHSVARGQSALHEAHRFTSVDRTPVAGPTTGRAGRRAPIRTNPYPGTVAAPVLTYRNAFGFDLAPEPLWQQIEAMDQFER